MMKPGRVDCPVGCVCHRPVAGGRQPDGRSTIHSAIAGKVLDTLIGSRELIAGHAVITMTEVVLGLIAGSALGFATALHLMVSPTARKLLMPIMVFSQAIPVFALAPVLTLWLGYGIWSKIVMTILIIYFPVASSFWTGCSGLSRATWTLPAPCGPRPTRC
jgi:putative hydroxymethylpyrimidine transport system permease protein